MNPLSVPDARDTSRTLFQTVLLTVKPRNALLACLSPISMIMLARTSKHAYDAVTNFNAVAYDINRHLRRFFANPLAFRSLQATTGTLISGSNALQFLNREVYSTSDLDLYTHPGYAQQIATWLIEQEEYRFLPTTRNDNDGDFSSVNWDSWAPWRTRFKNSPVTFEEDLVDVYLVSGIHSIYHFEKTTQPDTPPLRIQIMAARHTPLQAILNFHSSTSCCSICRIDGHAKTLSSMRHEYHHV